MEKIYEKNHNKEKNTNKKYSISVIFSFVIAIVAIVSLIIVGFNQISYSADGEVNFVNGKKVIIAKYNSKNVYVPTYFVQMGNESSDIKPIFCIEKAVDPGIGEKYIQGNPITDNGILYILNKSKIYNSNASGIISVSDVDDESNYEYMETYATQVALWLYLYKKGGAENDLTTRVSEDQTYSASEVESVFENALNYEIRPISGSSSDPAASTIDVSDSNGKIKNKINGIVSEARNNQTNAKILSVKFADGDIEEDGDYYKTPAVNISGNPSGDLVSYNVSVSGVDGAIVVDGDGNELTGDINKSVIYIKIPKDKITADVKSITVTANGTFANYLKGDEYVAADGSNYQKVVTVRGENIIISKGDTLEISASPDTGIFKNKTIFYTSIVLLLFGISVISATIIFFRRSRAFNK